MYTVMELYEASYPLDSFAYGRQIHRDLKPENIFITLGESNTVRLGDFGLARPGEAANKAALKGFTDPRLTASIGTSIYVAPEVRSSGGGSYNDKADVSKMFTLTKAGSLISIRCIRSALFCSK